MFFFQVYEDKYHCLRKTCVLWPLLTCCRPSVGPLQDSLLPCANRSFMMPGWKTWADCFTNLHAKPKFYSLTGCWETFNKLDKLHKHVRYHSLSLLSLRSTKEQQLKLVRGETSAYEWASGQQERQWLAQQELNANTSPQYFAIHFQKYSNTHSFAADTDTL